MAGKEGYSLFLPTKLTQLVFSIGIPRLYILHVIIDTRVSTML